MNRESQRAPAVGQLALDTQRGAVGVVMARTGPYIQLRPQGGGLEWDVLPEDVQPVTAAESLAPRVREANRQSTAGGGRSW
jgi:hypothetical protein